MYLLVGISLFYRVSFPVSSIQSRILCNNIRSCRAFPCGRRNLSISNIYEDFGTFFNKIWHFAAMGFRFRLDPVRELFLILSSLLHPLALRLDIFSFALQLQCLLTRQIALVLDSFGYLTGIAKFLTHVCFVDNSLPFAVAPSVGLRMPVICNRHGVLFSKFCRFFSVFCRLCRVFRGWRLAAGSCLI